MFRKGSLAGAAFAMSAAALIPAAPVAAQRSQQPSHGQHYGSDDNQGYDQQDRAYRDHRRNQRRHCNNDAGTIIGAIAGGLLGHSVAGRGDRTLGTVLGAGAGAFAGRAIDRSDDSRSCR